MNQNLHTKYRPQELSDVIGQDHIITSLASVLEKGSSHSFVFTGPAGVGKTTLARIVASLVGTEPNNVLEIDAATYTGIDAIRDITSRISYAGLGVSNIRSVIIDEAHALSKAAWQSLLKSLEEPPSHVYWMLCTTEAAKIPETIRTRCTAYDLKPVKSTTIFDLLKQVAQREGFTTSEDVIYLLAEKCGGSVRQAMSYLAVCSSVVDIKEAASLIQTVVGDDEDIIVIPRLLIKGASWDQLQPALEKLKDQNPEAIRQTVLAYMTKALLGTKDPAEAARLMNILNAFGQPYSTQNNLSGVILSIGQVIFAG